MTRRVASIVVAAVTLTLGAAACGGKARTPSAPAGGAPSAAAGPATASPDPAAPVGTELGDAATLTGDRSAALTDQQVEALGARLFGAIEAVAAAVVAHSEDCAAMAAAIDQVIADQQAVFAEVKAADDNRDNDRKFEAWMDKNQARAQALTEQLEPGLTHCADDASVQDALAKMSPS